MGVEKRLLDDAESFAKEITSLDEEGFISRTLAVLGISSKNNDAILEQEEETPKARPRPVAGPGRGHRPAKAHPVTPRLPATKIDPNSNRERHP